MPASPIRTLLRSAFPSSQTGELTKSAKLIDHRCFPTFRAGADGKVEEIPPELPWGTEAPRIERGPVKMVRFTGSFREFCNRGREKSANLFTIEACLRRARNATHTHPTPAQAAAGNYAKGNFKWQGLTIKIENPEGSTRRGKGKNGEWSQTMKCDYGYFKGTMGKDGDPVDVFLGEKLDSPLVAVIDQQIDGKFDEHKVVIGIESESDARHYYLANYPKGWKIGPITMTSVQGLKEWLSGPNTRKPFAGQQKEASVIATLVYRALPGIEKEAGVGSFLAKTLPSAFSRLGQAAPALFKAAPKSLGNTSGRLGNFAQKMGWRPSYRDMVASRRNLHVVEEMGPKQRLYNAGNSNILDSSARQRQLIDLGDNSLGHYQPGNHVIRYRQNPTRNTKRHELTHAYQFSTPGLMNKMTDWTRRGSGLRYNIGNAAIEAQAQIAGTQGLRKGLKSWGDVSHLYENGAKGIDRMPYVASRVVGNVADAAPAIAGVGVAGVGAVGAGAALANAAQPGQPAMAQTPQPPAQPNYAPAYAPPAQEKVAAAPNPALLLRKLQQAGIDVTPEHLSRLQKHLGAITHASAMASRDSADAAIRKTNIFGGANLPQAKSLFYGSPTIKTLTGGRKSPGLHQVLQDLISHVQPPPAPPKPTKLVQGTLF